MASRTITMYAEKQFELEEMKDAMKAEFYKLKPDVEFAGEVIES